MAKKTRLSNADEILRTMYPDLPTSDDDDEGFGGNKDKGSTDELAELKAQIAELKGQLSATSSRSSSPVPAARQDAAPQAPVIDYDKAPDPIQDPKGYAAFVRQATQAQIDYEKQAWQYQQRQAATQSSRVSELWNTFSENYKEYASNEERVEIAASRVIARAQAKGLDTEKYMYEQSDKFMQDVTSEIDKLFGKPKAGGEGDDGDEDDDDDDRSQILGGATAGREGPKGAKQGRGEAAKYGELGAEVKAWQQKVGISY